MNSPRRSSASSHLASHAKAHRPRRWFWMIGIGIVAAFCLIFFLLYQRLRPRTIRLEQSKEIILSQEGNGVFIFQEFSPRALSDMDFSSLDLDLSIRYRIDTPIASFDRQTQEELASLADQENDPAIAAYEKKLGSSGKLLMPFSGMLQIGTDPYAEIFTPESLNVMAPGDVAPKVSTERSSKGLTFFDNREFYLAVDVPHTTHPAVFQTGKRYALTIDGQIPLHGTLDLTRKNAHGDQLLIFSLQEGFQQIASIRFAAVNIESDRRACYAVPLSAVKEEGQETFCYVIDAEQVMHKVPVQILSDSETTDHIYITAAESSTGEAPSLHAFDDLLFDASEGKDGQMLR